MKSERLFCVGYSPLGDRVFAGMTDGVKFTGKKHDVTQPFIGAVIAWVGEDHERVVTTPDGDEWVITCERRKGGGK